MFVLLRRHERYVYCENLFITLAKKIPEEKQLNIICTVGVIHRFMSSLVAIFLAQTVMQLSIMIQNVKSELCQVLKVNITESLRIPCNFHILIKIVFILLQYNISAKYCTQSSCLINVTRLTEIQEFCILIFVQPILYYVFILFISFSLT